MDTSKIVGEKIKSLRESKNISREELAERSSLATKTISTCPRWHRLSR